MKEALRNPTARRMILLAFLVQSVSTSLVLGTYGVLVPLIEERFDTVRTFSSLGPPLIAVSQGLLAPLVGHLLNRISVRRSFITGLALTAAGFVLWTFVQNIGAFLFVAATFFGVGTALTGVFAPATLISRWYPKRTAFALALVTMPIFLVVMPPITAFVVERFGLNTWFLMCAVVAAGLIPLMMLVVDRPPTDSEATAVDDRGTRHPGEEPVRYSQLLRAIRFWMLTLCLAAMTGSVSAFLTHSVAFAIAKHIPVQTSALMITGFAAAGIGGNLIFGWLGDRIGPVRTLAVSALMQSLLWITFANGHDLVLLLAAGALIGMCAKSINALHAAASSKIFGQGSVSGVLGLGYIFKIPFNFGTPFFVGYMFVITGGYAAPFSVVAGTLLLAGAGLAVLDLLGPDGPIEDGQTSVGPRKRPAPVGGMRAERAGVRHSSRNFRRMWSARRGALQMAGWDGHPRP